MEGNSVSVIVPVYNAGEYLRQCLDSILAQTYGNFELICVDDGSTDDSLEVARSYAEQDKRVRVISQKNAGPGVARNAGLNAATGDFVYFLDSDDYIREDLLEKTVKAAASHEADIVAFPYFEHHMGLKTERVPWWALQSDRFPGEVVSWRDNPGWIFPAFQNLVWNKLFRRSLLDQSVIRFQKLYLSEDVIFTCMALVKAERIVVVDEPLVTQRQATYTNSMANKDRHPRDFLAAYDVLHALLEKGGYLPELEEAYVNWVIDGCIYNLHTLNTEEGFAEVFNALKDEWIARLALPEADSPLYHHERYRDFLRDLHEFDADGYAYRLFVDARNGRDAVEFERDRCNYVIEMRGQAIEERDRIIEERNRKVEQQARELEAREAEIDKQRHDLEHLRDEVSKMAQKAYFVDRFLPVRGAFELYKRYYKWRTGKDN